MAYCKYKIVTLQKILKETEDELTRKKIEDGIDAYKTLLIDLIRDIDTD